MAELDPALVDRAVREATKRAANLDYFFDKLSSSDWIEPLCGRGLFSEPPAQVIDDEGYVRAPGWSASRYLARVAASAPGAVLSAISSIDTDNERIHEDFVDAALSMPTEHAREIALQESAWLSTTEHLYYLLPERLTDLAAKLAAAGEITVATELIDALFAPTRSSGSSSGLQRPGAKFSAWDYDRLLQRVVVEILPASPSTFFEALVALLGTALDIIRSGDSTEAFDALSRIWRPRIADDGDRSREIEEALVSCVRDAVVVVRSQRLLPDDEVRGALTSRPEEILRRVAMYALAQQPEPAIEVVRDLVVDTAAITEGEPSVEYRLLLGRNAQRLPRSDVETLLEVVREGPDLDEYRDRAIRYGYDAPTDDQAGEYVAWWQAARLKLLLPALDDQWRARYHELISAVGDAELPTSGVVQTFTGPTSPFNAAELAAKSDSDLIAVLTDWRPGESWIGPSVEGLGRAIAEVAEEDPGRITTLLPAFRGLRPEYLEHVLRGLSRTLREDKHFIWAEVSSLISWLVDQPTRIDAISDGNNGDTAWMLARREAASLLEAGLLNNEGAPPVDLREPIWQAIRVIASDADPTPAHEEQYGGSNMDPVTLSLNTTRPRGIRAAIAYAIWLHRIGPSPGSKETLTVEVPEVGELLAAHMDSGADPSTSVRAAIAQHLTSLYAIDPAWATSHLEPLFPHADTPLREAAWGAYVIYSPPYNDLLSMMRSVYERSADLASSPGHGFRWMNGDPRSKLGEHLMTYYWRGEIGLDDPVFTTFWDRAPTQARGDALTFIGRATEEAGELDLDHIERLIGLWSFAVAHASPTPAEELAAFAWWFPLAAFRPVWRLEQLVALLDTGVRPDPGFLVTRALPTLTRHEPVLTVRALRGFLELERESWTITGAGEDIERVLASALESDDPDSRALAEDTVHWLGALGHRQYRALLS